jgi:hypothetical protein
MGKIHHAWNDNTACGRKVIDPGTVYTGERSGFTATWANITEDPKLVTCRRCLDTRPSYMG